MNLKHSSYTNGSYFRPKPVVVQREDSNLLVVATGWGPAELTQKAVDILVEQFELLSREDLTTPFEVMSSVSSPANRLMTGARLANQHLYKVENAKVWKTAVELTAIHYEYGILSWVHIGSPHILLHDGQNIHPLAYAADWIGQTANKGPLFTQALGMESNVNLQVGSIRLDDEAQLLLLSRSILPPTVLSAQGFDPAEVQRLLVEDDSEAPFWMGVSTLEKAMGRPDADVIEQAEGQIAKMEDSEGSAA